MIRIDEKSSDINAIFTDSLIEIIRISLEMQTINPVLRSFVKYDKSTGVLTVGNKNGDIDMCTYPVLRPLSIYTPFNSHDELKNCVKIRYKVYEIFAYVCNLMGREYTIYNGLTSTGFIYADDKLSKKCSNPIKGYENDFVVQIEITSEEFEKLNSQTLCFNEDVESIKVFGGSILLDRALKGNVYVNDILICNLPYLEYGYNLSESAFNIGKSVDLYYDFSLVHKYTSFLDKYGELIIDTDIGDVKDDVIFELSGPISLILKDVFDINEGIVCKAIYDGGIETLYIYNYIHDKGYLLTALKKWVKENYGGVLSKWCEELIIKHRTNN